ncbi:MAG TPA: hypothetical protein VGB97_04200 [Candidatus Paceibacterota bacterium]|jgi:hypothetical protein
MEFTTTPALPRTNRPSKGSWGALISIFLILAIVVAGAYYALTDRIALQPAEVTLPGTY